MALESHWKITPKDARITGDASYGFMRWTLGSIIPYDLESENKRDWECPKIRSYDLAVNHLSHVDPLVVILASRRRTHYLAKDGHFRNVALRTFMRATGQIETNRETGGAEALSSAAVVLSRKQRHWVYSPRVHGRKIPNHHFCYQGKLVLLDWQHHISRCSGCPDWSDGN